MTVVVMWLLRESKIRAKPQILPRMPLEAEWDQIACRIESLSYQQLTAFVGLAFRNR